MGSEIVVKVGRAATEAERKAIDGSKVTVLHPLPITTEVEGQYHVCDLLVQCPNCGAVGYAWHDPDQPYTVVYCQYCGTTFYA